ncbi:MAG: hypothetical protein Q4F71_02160 [Paracoccus sp. (in: a-proteobacteria)]|nr:hypothetical protein [Paracoccus sp. (in: a-proteobacteria)]
MSHDSDRFIAEVTEEIRRERISKFLWRYGWIGVLAVLAIVGGTAWREFSASRANTQAQAWGDSVLAAFESAEPAPALAAVDPRGSDQRAAIGGLLAAGVAEETGAGDPAALLEQAAARAGGDPLLRDLIALKSVISAGGEMAGDARDAVLSGLSAPGAPFRLMALEQNAVALIDAGRRDDALILIREIQAEPEVSSAMRRRLSEMMIALGAPMDEAISGMAGLPQAPQMN